MKCFVLFRLKPGVTPERYEAWFRATNVPAVRRLRTISTYRVWRLTGVMEGDAPFEYLEEMEFDDQAAFEEEIGAVPEMAAMLEGWYAQVADQAIVFAAEIAQD
jgi:hypothetical protein